MIKLFAHKYFLFFLLLLSFSFFICLAFFSEATYDPGDGIRHYLISRYSWAHHHLFLDSWGKPFFTFVTSPFSQFGLKGITMFNILCGIASAYFTYKIAKKINLNYPVLAPIILLFTPVYFPTLNSGLTEPFFGFILIVSIYLMLKENFVAACIIISFLPFIRTEGFLILPAFFIALILYKKFLLSPFLGTGTLVYSLIGLFVFGDFFWIKNQNPYNGNNRSFYGQGELFHFINNNDFILGKMLGIIFILGCMAWLYYFIIKKNTYATISPRKILFIKAFLIYAPFFIYFIAHSIMWWKGLANSLGLIRVLAAVAPCAAIICLEGLNLIMIPALKKNKYVEYALLSVFSFFVILNPFKQPYLPFNLDAESSLVKEAGDWFRESPYTKQKVYYLYPYFAHVLDVDPFDPNKVAELWGLYPSIKEGGIGVIPDSTIVIWDAHFGPNECQIPLDTILNDNNFQLLKAFRPAVSFTVLGGYPFEIYAFMKLPVPKSSKLNTINNLSFDFEQDNEQYKNTAIEEVDFAHSGKRINRLNSFSEYSHTVRFKMSEIPESITDIEISSFVYSEKDSLNDLLFVCSIVDASGKNILWDGVQTPKDSFKLNQWIHVKHNFKILKSSYKPTDEVSLYLWNKKKSSFYLDDLSFSFKGRY